MKTSQKGIDMIKHFEGLHDGDLSKIGLQPKLCPAGYWTEGYGHLILDEKGKRLSGQANKAKAYACSKIHTEEQAVQALSTDLNLREKMIDSLSLELSQAQFDALVSFVYNLGFENLKESVLLKRIRNHSSESLIRFEFSRWKYASGVIMTGLIKRRAAEADMFFS